MISDLHLVTRTGDFDLLSANHWATALLVGVILFASLGYCLNSLEALLLRLRNWRAANHRRPFQPAYRRFRTLAVAAIPGIFGTLLGTLLAWDPVNTEFYLRHGILSDFAEIATLTPSGMLLLVLAVLLLVDAVALVLLATKAIGLAGIPLAAVYLLIALVATVFGTLLGPVGLGVGFLLYRFRLFLIPLEAPKFILCILTRSQGDSQDLGLFARIGQRAAGQD